MDLYFIKSTESNLYVHFLIDKGYYVDVPKIGACLFTLENGTLLVNEFNKANLLTKEPLMLEKIENVKNVTITNA